MKVDPRVAAGGAAGAIATLTLWLVDALWKLQVPDEVASALTVVIAFTVGVLFPNTQGPPHKTDDSQVIRLKENGS